MEQDRKLTRIEYMRVHRRNWAKRNRDKVNAKRRERRRLKREKKLEGQYCLLCEIRMPTHSFGTRVYCRDCNERNYKRVREHTRQRYLKKKQQTKV